MQTKSISGGVGQRTTNGTASGGDAARIIAAGYRALSGFLDFALRPFFQTVFTSTRERLRLSDFRHFRCRKPALPAPVTGLLIRPEIRWDHAYTNNHPFNAQKDNNAFTIGVDAVLTF
jgi:hypothetical protein